MEECKHQEATADFPSTICTRQQSLLYFICSLVAMSKTAALSSYFSSSLIYTCI